MWIPIKFYGLNIDLKDCYDDRIRELIDKNMFGCEYVRRGTIPPWIDYRTMNMDITRAITIDPINCVGTVTEIDFENNLVNFELNEKGECLIQRLNIVAVPRIMVTATKLICFDISIEDEVIR